MDVATSGIAASDAISTPTSDTAAGKGGSQVKKVAIAATDTDPIVTITCDPKRGYSVRVCLAGNGSYTCQAFATTDDTDETAINLTHSGAATALVVAHTGHFWGVTGAARIVLTGTLNDGLAKVFVREEMV